MRNCHVIERNLVRALLVASYSSASAALSHRQLWHPGIRRAPAQPGRVPGPRGGRERDLSLIDCAQLTNNVCEVNDEWAFYNGYSDTNELDGCCVSQAQRSLQAVFGR